MEKTKKQKPFRGFFSVEIFIVFKTEPIRIMAIQKVQSSCFIFEDLPVNFLELFKNSDTAMVNAYFLCDCDQFNELSSFFFMAGNI